MNNGNPGGNNLGLDDLSGDSEDLAPLDVSGFSPKRPSKRTTTPKKAIRAASHDAGFHDRGDPTTTRPKPKASKKSTNLNSSARLVELTPKPEFDLGSMRRSQYYRTGRNTQLNIKVRSDDLERIKAFCDQQEWVLGQALEYALDALEQKIKNEQDEFWRERSYHGVE